MKFIITVKSAFIKASNSRRINRKKLTTSYVSLFLAFLILVSGTISWFTFNDTASVDSDTFSLEAASGLRVNEGEDLSNHIRLDDINLDEASSVDGRNMFFPTTGTFTDSTRTSVFREGNVGDKNQKYVYKDFQLKGDSGITFVYVKSYKITVTGEEFNETFNGSTGIQYDSSGKPVSQTKHDECPVRIAFITDSSSVPQVIDPTAIVDNYVEKYNAVSSTNVNGVASTAVSDGKSFSDYYFVTGSPIFTLYGNTPVNITMVIWLEGTENVENGKSNSNKYAGADISVDIELESNWADMDTITFVDATINDRDNGNQIDPAKYDRTDYWIDSAGGVIILMSYTDSDNITRTVVMKKNGDHSWIAPIPNDVTTNISFYRYDTNDEVIYNAWHTKVGVNDELNPDIKRGSANGKYWIGYYGDLQETRGTSTVYTAVRGNDYGKVDEGQSDTEKKRLSPCLGYWDYKKPGSGDSGSGDSGSGDSGDSGSGDMVGLGIALNTAAKPWIEQNATTGSEMYVQLRGGATQKIPRVSENRFEISETAYKVPKGSYIQTFYLKHSDGKITYLPVTQEEPVNSTYTYTFIINNDNKFEKQ